MPTSPTSSPVRSLLATMGIDILLMTSIPGD
jgi:hypothetical protein